MNSTKVPVPPKVERRLANLKGVTYTTDPYSTIPEGELRHVLMRSPGYDPFRLNPGCRHTPKRPSLSQIEGERD